MGYLSCAFIFFVQLPLHEHLVWFHIYLLWIKLPWTWRYRQLFHMLFPFALLSKYSGVGWDGWVFWLTYFQVSEESVYVFYNNCTNLHSLQQCIKDIFSRKTIIVKTFDGNCLLPSQVFAEGTLSYLSVSLWKTSLSIPVNIYGSWCLYYSRFALFLF